MTTVQMSIGGEATPPATPPAEVTATVQPNGEVRITPPNAPTPPAAPATERPAWLPEKFATAEDLVKSYTELERRFSAPSAPAAPPATPPVSPAGKVDFAAISAEYARDGRLSDATTKSLAELGIPMDVVNSYVTNQQAAANATRADLATTVGGEENFSAILKWAQTGLSPAERNAYDAMIASNNIEGAKLLLGPISQKYFDAVGIDPQLIAGEAAALAAGVKPFTSSAQVTAAMKDPRYEKDPAYREEVAKRLQHSNIFGTGR